MFSSNLAASLGLTSANATTGSHEGQTQSVSKTAEKSKATDNSGAKKEERQWNSETCPIKKNGLGFLTKAGEEGEKSA